MYFPKFNPWFNHNLKIEFEYLELKALGLEPINKSVTDDFNNRKSDCVALLVICLR